MSTECFPPMRPPIRNTPLGHPFLLAEYFSSERYDLLVRSDRFYAERSVPIDADRIARWRGRQRQQANVGTGALRTYGVGLTYEEAVAMAVELLADVVAPRYDCDFPAPSPN